MVFYQIVLKVMILVNQMKMVLQVTVMKGLWLLPVMVKVIPTLMVVVGAGILIVVVNIDMTVLDIIVMGELVIKLQEMHIKIFVEIVLVVKQVHLQDLFGKDVGVQRMEVVGILGLK